jgi:hypothetical protein
MALDDYVMGLSGVVSETIIGQIKDELIQKKMLPNLLKDDKKHVAYDKNNARLHVFIVDPKHPITVIRTETEDL